MLTSAVRDAANGEEFTAAVRERVPRRAHDHRRRGGGADVRGRDLRARRRRRSSLVIDIGGGSTELVTGRGGAVDFHVSMQAGVVRLGERHLHGDPPDRDELAALVEDFRATLAERRPGRGRRSASRRPIAVAGHADVRGRDRARARALRPDAHARARPRAGRRSRSSSPASRAMTLESAATCPGLHPDRAPTIVAGIAMLMECLRAFGLDRVEVSEHDILRGAALARAQSDRLRRASSFLGIAIPCATGRD